MVQIARLPEKGRTATPVSMNASFNQTVPYLVERLLGFSICAAVTETQATLAGTLKLQASNNAFGDNVNMDANSAAVWVDIANSSVNVSGSGNFMWNVTDSNYEAVRIVWTRSTGQGTITSYFLAKAQS